MYSPKCITEYRDDSGELQGGAVDLVHEPRSEPEGVELTTVFIGDMNSAPAVRARVQGAGIESWLVDGNNHRFSPARGFFEVLVCVKDETAAREILALP